MPFSLKIFFSFKKSLKILILRYVCDNYYFNNYRPTLKRLDIFQYSHHKSSNKSTKKILRVIDRIKDFTFNKNYLTPIMGYYMGQQFVQSYSVNFSYQKSEKDDSWQRQFIE